MATSMDGIDWEHAIIGIVSTILGAVSGLIAGIWRVAHIEQGLRLDFTQDIAESTNELSQKLTDLANHFDETLRGLRQKINDVELDTAKNFVSKPDFDDFRKEYREDIRDLKNSIAGISRNGRFGK